MCGELGLCSEQESVFHVVRDKEQVWMLGNCRLGGGATREFDVREEGAEGSCGIRLGRRVREPIGSRCPENILEASAQRCQEGREL